MSVRNTIIRVFEALAERTAEKTGRIEPTSTDGFASRRNPDRSGRTLERKLAEALRL